MKRRGGKKQPVRPTGRQRQQPTERQSAPAYAYRSQRADRPDAPARQQSSLAEKRSRLLSLQFWAKRSGAVVITLVIIISAISIVSLSTKPRIVLLDEGNTYAFQDPTTYERAASAQLASSFWNRNKLTVNTGGASKALQQQFPEISSVSVSLPLVGHRPIYYIQANAPAYIMQTSNGSYVLDAGGAVLLARADAPEAIANSLPVITDQTGQRAVLGKQFISSANADFIRTVVATLAAKQVNVESLVLPVGNVQQLDVRVAGRPFTIRFDMHDSGGARQQVGSYLATINTLDAQKKAPGQYIDVRVLGRAYYQ